MAADMISDGYLCIGLKFGKHLEMEDKSSFKSLLSSKAPTTVSWPLVSSVRTIEVSSKFILATVSKKFNEV